MSFLTTDPRAVPPFCRLPKACGADIELGNFIVGLHAGTDTGRMASRALLAEIEGLPLSRSYVSSCSWATSRLSCLRDEDEEDRGEDRRRKGSSACDSQDWGRKYLPLNGSCAYIDLDHLELCLPEVVSAWDHLACWHAMLRIARDAMTSANERLAGGRAIQVLVNNSDGHGHSYGSHLNFLITRRTWENIFRRRLHYLQYLAAFQVSSIVYTGQGKVGSENGAPPVAFQLSQRADFIETLTGSQTTFSRPVVNSRDESLCGDAGRGAAGGGPARLHVIFFDNTLAHVSSLLKVGVMQLVLAMMECDVVNPSLILEDPLEALAAYSADPSLASRARLATGASVTAVELQMRFLEEARRFADSRGFEEVVPGAAEILNLWESTLLSLRAADWTGLAPRLDWVMKRMALERAMSGRPSLSWDSPEIKHLDHLYSSLDPGGLYWAFEHSGFAERLVTEERIRHFCSNPPDDTRAWTRALLLRMAEPGSVEKVDWDSIEFRFRDGSSWFTRREIRMDDPLALTSAQVAPLLESASDFAGLLDAIEGVTQTVANQPRDWSVQ